MFLTKDGILIYIESLTGRAVYKILRLVNPELANRIKEHIFNDNSIIAFKVSYPFGKKIINNREVFYHLKMVKAYHLMIQNYLMYCVII